MNKVLFLLGCALIVFGIIFLIFSISAQTKVETKGAVVGFIGPIPFGFGTDRQTLSIAVAVSLILLIAYFVFWFILRKPF